MEPRSRTLLAWCGGANAAEAEAAGAEAAGAGEAAAEAAAASGAARGTDARSSTRPLAWPSASIAGSAGPRTATAPIPPLLHPLADPRVVDVLIYKGREELESIVLQHKQRHHLVGAYVLGPRAMRKASRVAAEGVAGGRSAFLDAFLKNTA